MLLASASTSVAASLNIFALQRREEIECIQKIIQLETSSKFATQVCRTTDLEVRVKTRMNTFLLSSFAGLDKKLGAEGCNVVYLNQL